ncbi:hypothetical protein [Actinopolyspora mortivallis]|uniref:hypothetical protein n=1 Tax=Actinopolyspora mortivallis TaxID=33906 RepID=UPI00035C6E3E|nr:hypothetical protein [Actinopolyspora mortivallis]
MLAESDRAVVLGWDGVLVCRGGEGVRPVAGVTEALRGARRAGIPVIVLTELPVGDVAAEARRLDIVDGLAVVIADAVDQTAELRRLAREYPRLARVGGTEEEIRCARCAGVLAFGFSGAGGSGPRLRAAGAEAVFSRMDRALALRVTASRLFATS